MRLQGKTAIVTGGASGFGAGIVRKFIAEGARGMIADINSDAATALAVELGDRAAAHKTNVSVSADVEALAQSTLSTFQSIDILINNAGVTHLPMEMEQISEADFDRVFAVNAKSVFLTAKHIVPGMKARGSGSILNIASTGGVSTRANLSWYNASKGCMITPTRLPCL